MKLFVAACVWAWSYNLVAAMILDHSTLGVALTKFIEVSANVNAMVVPSVAAIVAMHRAGV